MYNIGVSLKLVQQLVKREKRVLITIFWLAQPPIQSIYSMSSTHEKCCEEHLWF